MTAVRRLRVLFLCGANSGRSQMAEGWLRSLGGFGVEAHSAGSRATAVHPFAVRAMRERGVDIASQWSKTADKVPCAEMDFVITLCAEGAQACPTVPGKAERLHWPVDDPSAPAATEEEVLGAFRRARDEIEVRVRDFLKARGR